MSKTNLTNVHPSATSRLEISFMFQTNTWPHCGFSQGSQAFHFKNNTNNKLGGRYA